MSNGALMLDSEVRPEQNGHSDPSSNGSSSSLFQRRIEFHLARKPFNGFSNGAGDFKIETLNPSSGSGKFGSGSGQKNGNVKKTDGSDLIDFGLDPELIFGFSLRRIGAGLENLGNTCFLNSVLQCLTHTEPLAAYLQSGKHQNSCRVAGFCALCAIQKHVSRALQSSGRILAPKDLVSNLRCISRNFRNARQEDAHEYMVNLLESMHKCCLPSGVPGESACAYEKSLVHKIFGGRLRSQVKCLQCSYCSDTFDPFLDLSLEIAKADSLDGALRHFTNAELLDGGERQYNCQQCKQKVRAMKRLTVHKAPYVLTIHLKRFRAHDPGQKIDKKIRFCPALDLKPFVSGSHKGELKYTLYGVLVHHGWSTHSGHYYCFVRTSTGIWHSLDDNRVVPVSEKIVLEQKAYMLFYVRDRQSFVPRKPVNIAQKENMKENVTGNGTCLNISHSSKDPLQNGANENQPKILDPSPSVQKNALNTDLSKTSTLNEEPVSKSIGSVIRQTLLPKKDPALKSSKKEQKTVDPLKGLADSASEKERTVLLTVSSIAGNGCTAHDHENDSPKHEARCNDNHQSAADKVETDKAQEKVEDSPSNNMESSLKLMEQSVPSNISSQGVDRKVSENTCCRRFKIFLNGKTASMRLGKHMFLRASLEVWKKRKQRKIKCSTSNARNLIQESVRDSDAISLDFGPSTSEKVRKNSLDTTHSKRKRVKSPSGKDGKNVSKSRSGGLNSESLMNNMDGELQGRVNQTGAVTNGQLQYISCSGIAEDQSDAPKHSSTLDCKGDTLQNGFIGMLNQGLEEPMVARWDDIDSPPPKLVESTSAKNLSIGYVPDEWDEEYDRGKRKKLRSFKHTFDGPNLFQEIANKQLQSKKIKMDQSSSGSKPFRI